MGRFVRTTTATRRQACDGRLGDGQARTLGLVKRLLVFGDSYVAAADRMRPGYARIVPLLLGWRGEHMGRGGTGFVRTSGDRREYADRLAELLTRRADVLVVQATGNDATCDLADVDAATRAFLSAVVGRFPRVVVIGPMWAKDGSEHLPALRDVTSAATSDAGAEFVDALGWVRPADIGPDGAHPTWAGHWRIARKVATSIRL